MSPDRYFLQVNGQILFSGSRELVLKGRRELRRAHNTLVKYGWKAAPDVTAYRIGNAPWPYPDATELK